MMPVHDGDLPQRTQQRALLASSHSPRNRDEQLIPSLVCSKTFEAVRTTGENGGFVVAAGSMAAQV
jgi:hypothetical protein